MFFLVYLFPSLIKDWFQLFLVKNKELTFFSRLGFICRFLNFVFTFFYR